MAAVIQVFKDSGAINLYPLIGSNYDLQLGPVNGLNGADGDLVNQSIYIKNTGTMAASNVTIAKSNDPNNNVSFSMTGVDPVLNQLLVGTMTVGQIVEIIITVSIPMGTPPLTSNPYFSFSFLTLP